jgi:CheY-like chemotaxis protein
VGLRAIVYKTLRGNMQKRKDGSLPSESGAPGGDEFEVVVVGPDPILRDSIADLLGDLGYRAQSLADGSTAIEYLANQPSPRAIVLDTWERLVGADTVANRVLAGADLRCPVLLLTDADRLSAPRVPQRYILHKPFNIDRLLELLAELAGSPRR